MTVFTVTKPGGTKDYEFVAYTQLLENVGIDVAKASRIPEPGTDRRWLYVWKTKEQAERFARELQVRTKDRSWHVHEFDRESESWGPVVPLDIYTIRELEGNTYYLDPASRERMVKRYPQTHVYQNLFLSKEKQDKLIQEFGPVRWDQICHLLTGLTDEEINQLGGYRIFEPAGTVAHEKPVAIPTSPV